MVAKYKVEVALEVVDKSISMPQISRKGRTNEIRSALEEIRPKIEESLAKGNTRAGLARMLVDAGFGGKFETVRAYLTEMFPSGRSSDASSGKLAGQRKGKSKGKVARAAGVTATADKQKGNSDTVTEAKTSGQKDTVKGDSKAPLPSASSFAVDAPPDEV